MIATITKKQLFTVEEYLEFEESEQEKYAFHHGKIRKIILLYIYRKAAKNAKEIYYKVKL